MSTDMHSRQYRDLICAAVHIGGFDDSPELVQNMDSAISGQNMIRVERLLGFGGTGRS